MLLSHNLENQYVFETDLKCRGRLGVIQGCEPPLIKLNPEMGTDCKQAQAGQQ